MKAKHTPNALIWLWLSGLIIVLDQISKWIVLDTLTYNVPVPFIEGFWNWTLVHNYGAAFSFLSQASGWQRWLFSVLAVVISIVLMFWLRRLPRHDWYEALPFAMIIGGALGNLIDRLRFGYVIDFVQWGWWPVFNIADSAITVGAVLLVSFSFFRPKAG